MRTRTLLAGLVVVAAASVAEAQCTTGGTAVQDACRKAQDLISFVTPQLSTALAGGNPTLGQGGVLGGLGHFSIDIRASAVNGSLPQLNNVGLSVTGATASSFTSKNQLVPAASLDAGVGLWRGVSLGVTHVGGVDALVTMTYLPTIDNGSNSTDVGFKVNGSNTKFGYGVRVGLLEESVVLPGVSFAWVQRDLPSVTLSGTVSASGANPGGTLALNDYTIKTSVWRLTAAKNLLIFNFSAGYGQDKYDATSTISATVNAVAPVGTQTGSGPANVSLTRSNLFAGVAINLFLFKLEAEYGQASGGTVTALKNSFGSDPNKSRSYFTLGLRFGR